MAIDVTYRRRLRDRVSRGAKFMDDVDPGWQEKIDLSIFKMDDASYCILGQRYMGYINGLRDVGLTDGDGFEDEEKANTLGFVITDCPSRDFMDEQAYWDFLAAYWINEIHKRQANI